MTASRKPLVFICYASPDRPLVYKLYERLKSEIWIEPWMDREKILVGQDWEKEIKRAVEAAAVVILCLTDNALTKEGYFQKELRFIFEIAKEKPEGTIFIIPLRLTFFEISRLPSEISRLHISDFYSEKIIEWAYPRLLESIRMRFEALGLDVPILPTKTIILSKEERQSLIDLANQTRRKAYAPYSHYSVGAALRTKWGNIYTGVNVENAAYPNTMCAERAAVFKAVAEGEREFEAIAVVTENGGSPCGGCRQVLAEFSLDAIVLLADGNGKLIKETTVRKLLPEAFTPDHLSKRTSA